MNTGGRGRPVVYGTILHSFSNGSGFYALEDWGGAAGDVTVASAGVNSLYVFYGGASVTTRLYF